MKIGLQNTEFLLTLTLGRAILLVREGKPPKIKKAERPGDTEMARNNTAVLEPTDEQTQPEVTEQTQENGTAEATTEKRKRVDVEALAASNPNEKVVLSLNIPAGLKLAIRKAADTSDISEAQYVRDLLSEKFEYVIPDEFNERKHRTGKYAGLSEEEKKAAIARDNATKRDTVNKLLAQIASGGIDQETLARLGIDPSMLPKPRAEKDETATE